MLPRNKEQDLRAARGIADEVMKEWEDQGKGWLATEVADEVVKRLAYYRVYHSQIESYVEGHSRTR